MESFKCDGSHAAVRSNWYCKLEGETASTSGGVCV
jgi:hypothetical protein